MSFASVSMSRRSGVVRMADSDASPRLATIAAFVLAAVFLAAVALISLPVLRSATAALGAAPLWLLGMPLASLSALAVAHRDDPSQPGRRTPDPSPVMRRQRSGTTVQARRRSATAHSPGRARAA